MALRKRRKSAPPPRRRGPLRRLARGILQAVLLAGAVAVAWVALYRVVPPPTTFLIESERLRLESKHLQPKTTTNHAKT